MGLFSRGPVCCLCGGKTNIITRIKLADGQYICGECRREQCGIDVPFDIFESSIRKEDLPAVMEAHKTRTERCAQFQVTRSILSEDGAGILADEVHGWWVPVNHEKEAVKSAQSWIAKEKLEVFEFSQCRVCKVKLDTGAPDPDAPDYDRVDYQKLPLPRPDFPVCPNNQQVDDVGLSFELSDPYIPQVEICGLIVTKMRGRRKDFILTAYQVAADILTCMEQHQGKGSQTMDEA